MKPIRREREAIGRSFYHAPSESSSIDSTADLFMFGEPSYARASGVVQAEPRAAF
jgi:hypothetical protein